MAGTGQLQLLLPFHLNKKWWTGELGNSEPHHLVRYCIDHAQSQIEYTHSFRSNQLFHTWISQELPGCLLLLLSLFTGAMLQEYFHCDPFINRSGYSYLLTRIDVFSTHKFISRSNSVRLSSVFVASSNATCDILLDFYDRINWYYMQVMCFWCRFWLFVGFLLNGLFILLELWVNFDHK